DYKAYEQERDEFIRSERGHATLLKGGIVRRLAHEIANIQSIYMGPEPNRVVQECEIEGTTYIEDELTPQELDVIVGLYRILTPQSDKQGSFVSWWPPADVWAVCGVNMGYWTRENENWFQRRLDGIRNNVSKPLTRQQWRSEL
ncbi:hypothetical protein BDW22DRAFT_1302985, partial [Trametopsis cervina]